MHGVGLVIFVFGAAVLVDPGGYVSSVRVAVLRPPLAGAASALMSCFRIVCMRGGGFVSPPLCAFKVISLVGRVVGWLCCGPCPKGV